jgi:hypothetical protein
MAAIAFDSWMYDLSLWEALAMQAVGVLGGNFIQLGLPPATPRWLTLFCASSPSTRPVCPHWARRCC